MNRLKPIQEENCLWIIIYLMPLAIALDYAQLWPVLPLAGITEDDDCDCSKGTDCPRPGKHPLIKGGLYSATQDEATIKGWVAIWPQANIGIRTGRESGLLVLDEDPRNGGRESLDRLKSHYASLPRTLMCLTGGGWLALLLPASRRNPA